MKTDFTEQEFDRGAVHPVQSYAWGEFRRENGAIVERFMDHETSYTVLFHAIPFTPLTLGILTQSPVPNKRVISYLRSLAVRHRAISIKIEPYFYEKVDHQTTITSTQKFLLSLGLVKAKPLYPMYSFVMDLNLSEDVLFSKLKSKTRYNVRLARKKGVATSISTSDAVFDDYIQLLEETTRRQSFFAHTSLYQKRMWKHMKGAGIAFLARADYKGDPLACFVLFVFNGKLYYPYGASTRNHKELMAPQLLMWETICFGKKENLTTFDLWGSLGVNPPENHSWYGFHRFKEGFGGDHVSYVGAYDLVSSRWLYSLYTIADRIRWFFLKKIFST